MGWKRITSRTEKLTKTRIPAAHSKLMRSRFPKMSCPPTNRSRMNLMTRAGKLDKLLSRGGVSPDCRDNQGSTPLIVACEAGNAALAGVLIRHNEDVNAVDADDETPLIKAAYGGHLDVVQLLISKAADSDVRNIEGLSALEIAQEMEHEAVVAFLSAQTACSTGRIEADTSTDPDDNGPAGASVPVPAVMMPSPAPPAYVPNLDLEPNPELEKPPDLEPQKEPEKAGEYREEEPVGTTPDRGSHSKAGEQAGEARTRMSGQHDTGKKTDTRPGLPAFRQQEYCVTGFGTAGLSPMQLSAVRQGFSSPSRIR
jgi:hypothetical protein